MLLEQAFYALPEVLHGSGYQTQDYESGVVAAYSLALLQVLNGRNIDHPIGCLQMERLFRDAGVFSGAATPRYLRADLFVNLQRMMVANKRLSQYGWRHSAWLEAKFFRNPKSSLESHSGNKTNYVAGVLADLIRLAGLVPEVGDKSTNGRYFLHLYDKEPKYYLTFSARPWCKVLCTAGSGKIKLKNLDSEPDSIKALLGKLPGLEVELDIRNVEAIPVDTAHRPIYWCYLTRIDALKISLGNDTFGIDSSRAISEKGNGRNAISQFIAEKLHINEKSRESFDPGNQTDGDGSDLGSNGA